MDSFQHSYKCKGSFTYHSPNARFDFVSDCAPDLAADEKPYSTNS